jgi:hypothetical protein
VAAAFASASARADSCIDASEEARALLGRRRLLEARSRLRLCAASGCDESVRGLCDERLAEVSARLPSVIFDVKDRDGRDLPNVAVTIDEAPYAGGAGTEITLDPGQHVFVFSVDDEEPVEQRLVLVEREKGRREHIVIGRAREHSGSTVASSPRDRAVVAPVVRPRSPWQTAGWIAIGASAVGFGIGTAFGISAVTKNDDARCDASNVCDDPRSRHDARIAANVSTVSFIVGGALAATGVAFLFLGPKRAPSDGAGVVVTSSAAGGGTLALTKSW